MYKCEHYTDSIFYQLKQTARLCKYLGSTIFAKLNIPITLDEFAAMDIIMVNGEICQRDLAKLLLKDRPNTGRILDSLEEKKYIERFADTKNNRLVRRMKLTSEGESVFNMASEIIRNYVAKTPRAFSEDDKKQLKFLLQKFKESLEQEVEVNI